MWRNVINVNQIVTNIIIISASIVKITLRIDLIIFVFSFIFFAATMGKPLTLALYQVILLQVVIFSSLLYNPKGQKCSLK